MFKRILLIGILCSISRGAEASNYYWSENAGTVARYIYTYTVTLAPCTNNVFETKNLSAGADTVLYLTANNTEVAFNDDYSGQLRSRVTYNISCGGSSVTVKAYVVAHSNASGGDGGKTYDFFANGLKQNSTPLKLGGYRISKSITASESMETVLVNDGARATMLVRLWWDGSHWKFVGVDQSSGVGSASKLYGGVGASEWLIGTPTATVQDGKVRLVRNDAALGDTDGDGLGNGVENEACTCYAPYSNTCSGTMSCGGATQDSDADGLTDKWEMIGVDVPLFPICPPPSPTPCDAIMLPLWGASPRHKDVFVEVDRGSTDDISISELTATFVAGKFASVSTVQNLDGNPGIAVHFDIGIQCNGESGDIDGIRSECGNYGGASIVAPGPNGESPACASGFYSSRRAGTFHWMWLSETKALGSGKVESRCTWLPENPSAATIAHELGHNLGLRHWGADPTSGAANGKPNYPSLMNYIYNRSSATFSSGSLSSTPLNPRALSETTDWGGSGSLSPMRGSPYFFSVDSESPRHIDWNRDGEWDASVRAHVIPPPHRGNVAEPPGGTQVPNYIGQENIPGLNTNDGIGTAYFAAKSWVVGHSDDDNRLYLTTTTATSGGWSTWQLLPSSPLMRSDSGPAMAVYGSEVYVFAVGASSPAVRYAKFDTLGSIVGSWGSISLAEMPPGSSVREVSVATTPSRVYLATRNDLDDTVWLGWLENSVWSGWRTGTYLFDNMLTPVASESTPAIVVGPNGLLYIVAEAPSTKVVIGNQLDMFRYDPSNDTWTNQDLNDWDLLSGEGGCQVDGRIAALFRPYRTGSGTPLASGNGALWIWYMKDCGGIRRVFYRWTLGKFNATTQNFEMGWWHEAWMGACSGDACGVTREPETETRCWNEGAAGVGFALIDHPQSLAAFTLQAADGTCPNAVYHVPYADGEGTPTTLLNDNDDGATMAGSMCVSVHDFEGDDCKCPNNFGGSCVGIPPEADLEICEPPLPE